MYNFFNDYIQNLETYIMFRIKESVAQITPELQAKNRAPIFLSMGAPTQAPPKFAIDKLKQVLDEEKIHTYSSSKGEKFFREAIAAKMKSRYNVELDADKEIFSLIGSKEGIANFIRALINPTTVEEEKEVIFLPDPGYASYKEMVKVSGGKSYSVPLLKENNYMPDMEVVLSNYIKEGGNPDKIKAMLINYPNNPLGCTATKEYFESIVRFCKKHNILLISDAAYNDLYLKSDMKPVSILEIEGAKDIAVEFYSFSKPYAMTGWRLGWVCGNREAVGIFGKLKSVIDSGIFKALQKSAAMILNSEEGDKYIEDSNQGFRRKQNILVDGLKELGWKNFNIPDATFYLWLPIPERYKTSFEFTDELMRKSGIVTAPGDAFGKYGEGFFRVSAVCSDDELREVIRRMKEDGFYFE